ncbi:MAG: hypothetical protein ACRD5L_17300, partial [Bryobacteraceae bacterium]
MSPVEQESPQPAKARRTWRWIAWLPSAVLPIAACIFRDSLQPWLFMWALAFAIFAGLKWLTWWKARAHFPHAAWRSASYLFAWPGMDAESFLDEARHPASPPTQQWLWALAKTAT